MRNIEWINKENVKKRECLATDIRFIYVEFDDPSVGYEYIKTHKYKHPVNANWIPIKAMEAQYTYHRQRQARFQLPVVLAYGIT